MRLKLGPKFKSKLVVLSVKLFPLGHTSSQSGARLGTDDFFLQNKMNQYRTFHTESPSFGGTRLHAPQLNTVLASQWNHGIVHDIDHPGSKFQHNTIVCPFFSFSRRQCQTGDVRFAMVRDVAFGRKSLCWELDTRSGRGSFPYLQYLPNDYAWGNHSFLLTFC